MFFMVAMEGCLERSDDMTALFTAHTVMVVLLLISPAKWVRER